MKLASASKRRRGLRKTVPVILTLITLYMFANAVMSALVPTVSGDTKTSTYTVKLGDTLWEIALKADDTRDTREVVLDIEQLNGLQNSDIYPGEVLKVPSK